MSVDRTEALSHELKDVVQDFDNWTTKELPAINSALTKKTLEPITPQTREKWDAANGGAAGAPPTTQRENFFERD